MWWGEDRGLVINRKTWGWVTVKGSMFVVRSGVSWGVKKLIVTVTLFRLRVEEVLVILEFREKN